MKNYLESFFNEFEYKKEDSAFLLSEFDKILNNEETKAIWEEAISIYEKDIDCDYKEIIAMADNVALKLYMNEYTVEFLIFASLTKHMREVYKEKGIEDEIFKNTIQDLKYKLLECQEVKGVTGTFVAEWFSGFFKLTRFALGRLQFEIKEFGNDYEKDGYRLTPESKVINVHIPRSLTPLDEKSCDEAFMMAKEFFEKETGGVGVFVCHSWLLYPEHKEILNEKSNVYRFMMRFDMVEWGIDKHKKELWRLFDTDEQRVEKFPTDSSFRRAYVEHLKKGGKTGWGYGVFFI